MGALTFRNSMPLPLFFHYNSFRKREIEDTKAG